jgi:PHP family Zn ribbon phosphoesterase
LAVVQEVKNAGLLDLKCLAQIATPNVTRVLALYHQKNKFYAAYEYTDLDIVEIGPLSDKEIANAFLQVRTLTISNSTTKQVAP